jgi:hypothetical protein
MARRGSDHDFWYGTITDLANNRPEWAAEVLGQWLLRQEEVSLSEGQPNPFDSLGGRLGREQAPNALLKKIAQAAPSEFVTHVLEFMLRLMEANAGEGSDDQARMDRVWGFRHASRPLGLEDQLLEAMEAGLRKLAETDPKRCRPFIQRLKVSTLDTAQFLAARAYLGSPAYFADEAAKWLCDSRTALHLGYSDSPLWASRELVAAVSPFCSEEILGQLMEVLLRYETAWERRPENRSIRGRSQWILLGAVDPNRRSVKATRRVAELERKFGEQEPPAPEGIVVDFVGPPIPPEAAAHMTDEHWLSAMAKHSGERSELTRGGGFVGGAAQQAQVLKEETSKDPTRFARLILRFPDGTAEPYVSAVVRGIAEAEQPIDADLLGRVCLRATELGGSDTGRWIADLLARRAHEDMSEEVLELLVSLATQDPDPDQDIWRVAAPSGQPYLGGDVDSAALNCTRGEAVMSIGRVVLAKPERLATLAPALRRAAQDPIRAVRVATIEAVRYVRVVDASLALELFSAATEGLEEDVLTSRYLERFVHDCLRDHFDDVQPVLARMVTAQEPAASEAGSRQFAVASFFHSDLDAEVDQYLQGSVSQRKGAVEVFADNLAGEFRRDRCIQACIQAFDDDNKEVREAATRGFFALRDVELAPFARLFDSFAMSKAMADDPGPALHTLSESKRLLPDTALRLCERFVELHGSALADISTSAAGDALDVGKIVMRVYVHSRDAELRSRCLDLLDRMVEMGAYGIERQLELLTPQ